MPVPQPRSFDVPRYVARAPSPLVFAPVEDHRIRIAIESLQIGDFHATDVRCVLDPTRRLLVYDIFGADFRIDVATNAVTSIAITSTATYDGHELTTLELELSWPPRLRGDVDITRSQASLCLHHRLVVRDPVAAAQALRQIVALRPSALVGPPHRATSPPTRPPTRWSISQPESFVRGGQDAVGSIGGAS